MKSDDAPFNYGTTVSDMFFTNREREIVKLKSNLTSGINTILMSPRRWGKSSLVEKVIQEIDQQYPRTRTVVIDLFSVSNEEAFLEAFACGVIKASSEKWQDWINNGKEFFKRLMPVFSMGIDPASDFSLSFDLKELKRNSDEILNLPETIGRKKAVKFIVCLDEFQQLATFRGYDDLEKKMRAAWQRHKNVTYCLYGSRRHMMTDIFSNRSRPFYRFGDIMILSKIEAGSWVKFICSRFSKTGKFIDPQIADVIAKKMKNHSWCVQQLSHYTWNITQRKATPSEVDRALKELIQANSPLYERECEILSSTQVNLLKAVTSGETRFTSVDVMNTYRIGTPRNVSKNKSILIQNDVIQDNGEGFEFVDPAFEIWFRWRFLHKPWSLTD